MLWIHGNCSEVVHVVGGGTSGIGGIVVIGGRIGIVVWFVQCCDVVSSWFHGGSIGTQRL